MKHTHTLETYMFPGRLLLMLGQWFRYQAAAANVERYTSNKVASQLASQCTLTHIYSASTYLPIYT
jgi:hypothetical protein